MLHPHLQHFPVQGLSHGAHARRACPFGSEITGRVQVGVQRVATCAALKDGLGLPVLALGMSTTTTTLTRMPGVFFDHLHSSQCRFVGDEVEQLRKRPAMHHPVDLARQLHPVTDAKEFLDVQYATMGRNTIDDLPADLVIHLCGPAGFFPFRLFNHPQFAFLLEGLTVSEEPPTDVAQWLAIPELYDIRTTQDRNICHAQVKTKMRTLGSRNILTLYGQHEIPVTTTADKFRHGMRQGTERTPSGRNDDGQPQEPRRRCHAHHALLDKYTQILRSQAQRQHALQSWTRGLLPLALPCLDAAIDRQGFVTGLLDCRGRQQETVACFVVAGRMQTGHRRLGKPVRRVQVQTNGIGKRLLHRFQALRFAPVHCSQFELKNSRLHRNIILQGGPQDKAVAPCWSNLPFPCRLKATVPLQESLWQDFAENLVRMQRERFAPAIAAIRALEDVYGHLHIVLDDENYEDEHLRYCEEYNRQNLHEMTYDQLVLERACLAALWPLTPYERKMANTQAEADSLEAFYQKYPERRP